MAIAQMLFDDHGDVWSSVDPQLAVTLGCILNPKDLSDYVVKNLGFIELAGGHNGVRVRFRREKVSEAALASLLYWLSDNPQERVAITTFGNEPLCEIVVGQSALLRTLEKLVTYTTVSERRRFFHEALGPDVLLSQGAHAKLYASWLQGELRDRASIASFCDLWFKRRYTIVKVSDGTELQIDIAGSGYDCYESEYIDKARGSRLEDEPDWKYGQWIAKTHWDVVRANAPAIHNVDADIGATKSARTRFTYRRVLLPFTEKGTQFILTASLPQVGLSLRTHVA